MLRIAAIIVLLISTPLSAIEGKFKHESSASIVVTGGNSVHETYNTETLNQYEYKNNIYKLGGHYTLGTSSGIESARNWDANARYDRILSKYFNLSISEQFESNKFSGFSRRENSDLITRYQIHKSDSSQTAIEMGYRYTIERRVNNLPTNKSHKGRLYLETSAQITKTLYTKCWLEYIPNFSNSKDFLINFEPSLEVIISKIFSLKFAYKGGYDHQPALPTSRNFDYMHSTTLIARF